MHRVVRQMEDNGTLTHNRKQPKLKIQNPMNPMKPIHPINPKNPKTPKQNPQSPKNPKDPKSKSLDPVKAHEQP